MRMHLRKVPLITYENDSKSNQSRDDIKEQLLVLLLSGEDFVFRIDEGNGEIEEREILNIRR